MRKVIRYKLLQMASLNTNFCKSVSKAFESKPHVKITTYLAELVTVLDSVESAPKSLFYILYQFKQTMLIFITDMFDNLSPSKKRRVTFLSWRRPDMTRLC